MKRMIKRMVLILLFVAMFPTFALAKDVQTTITPKQSIIYVQVGKAASISLTVSPQAARNKGLTYESDNEAIATATTRGRVIGVSVGSCNIIVTSKYDESVSIKIPVMTIIPAKKMTVTAESNTVTVGSTLPLTPVFEPAETSVQGATYKSGNNRIATVDENGVVTGVRAGKTTITATAIDGSRVHARFTVTVVQSVTGVSYKTPHVRVGVNYHGTFTATLEPKNATNKKMTWESQDPSIATVSGTKNSVRIQGKQWGQTVITGTTEDGGYKVSIIADIGSLTHAVRIRSLDVRNGKPRMVLQNGSNMNITQVHYQIRGYDSSGNVIQMSSKRNEIVGSYDLPLAPSERTEHGKFTFNHQIHYSGLAYFKFAITGWTCEEGYYDRDGVIHYDYHISERNWEWIPNADNIPTPR